MSCQPPLLRHAGALWIFGSSHGGAEPTPPAVAARSLLLAVRSAHARMATPGARPTPTSCSPGVTDTVSEVRFPKMTATMLWSMIAWTCTGAVLEDM